MGNEKELISHGITLINEMYSDEAFHNEKRQLLPNGDFLLSSLDYIRYGYFSITRTLQFDGQCLVRSTSDLWEISEPVY